MREKLLKLSTTRQHWGVRKSNARPDLFVRQITDVGIGVAEILD